MNRRLYHSTTPPEIDLKPINNLNIAQVMIIGRDDTIAFKEDSYWIRDQIGKSVRKVIETEGGHNHFFFGKDANYFVEALDYVISFKESART